MKIEKLTENKIRIILNLEDLKKKHLDLHSFMSNSIESQNLFADILTQAEKEVGFSTKNCKILIEALASSEGDFIFIITKHNLDAPQKETTKKKTLNIKRKTHKLDVEKAIYSFHDFEEFCLFCSHLYHNPLKDIKKLAKKISLYLYNNTYYLVLNNINTAYSDLKCFYASVAEFGELVSNSPHFESKLIEHGKLIMKHNAITKGIKYFA